MVPDAPVLTATAGFQQITVSWPAVTGATRYELWAWLGSWSQLDGGTLTATSHVHDGLSTGRTYYYQGRAVNSAGVMSAWSAQVSATVLSTPNISAPTSVSAARGDQKVTLSWTAATAPAGQTIASYEYRHAASGETLPATWTNVGNVLTKEVGSLTNGTTYSFELRAVSNTGATGNAGSASATPATVPGSPTLTATAADNDKIVLTWTAPASDGGAAISSYRIERQNTDGSWTTQTSRPGSVLTWTATSLARATSYTYRIFAVNNVGDSDWTSSSARTLANAITTPNAPVAVSATGASGSIMLTWSPPVFNGGSAVTKYQYRYKRVTAPAGGWTGWTDATTPAEITGLAGAVEYDVELVAVNIRGRGDAFEATVLTLATAPTGVPSITVSMQTDSGASDRQQIRVEWNTVDADGGADIAGYEIQWKTDDDDDYECGYSDDRIDDLAATPSASSISLPKLSNAAPGYGKDLHLPPSRL